MSAPRPGRHSGLTTVELLVSAAVTAILLAGVFRIYTANTHTARLQNALSQLQEHARFASHFLARDIRAAGYRGCSRHTGVINTLDAADTLIRDFRVAIEGYESVGRRLPARLADSGIIPLVGTDVLVVRTIEGAPVSLIGRQTGNQLVIAGRSRVTRGCPGGKPRLSGFCEGDSVLVSDCAHARIHRITALRGSDDEFQVDVATNGRPDTSPGAFGPDAEMQRVSTRVYYIAPGVDDEPTLYRRVGSAASEPLADGVENMRFRFGVDTDGDRSVDDYRPADAVSSAEPGGYPWRRDWERVRAVQVSLLLRSTDGGLLEHGRADTHHGTPASSAPDRRLRHTVRFTVALRNRTD